MCQVKNGCMATDSFRSPALFSACWQTFAGAGAEGVDGRRYKQQTETRVMVLQLYKPPEQFEKIECLEGEQETTIWEGVLSWQDLLWIEN